MFFFVRYISLLVSFNVHGIVRPFNLYFRLYSSLFITKLTVYICYVGFRVPVMAQRESLVSKFFRLVRNPDVMLAILDASGVLDDIQHSNKKRKREDVCLFEEGDFEVGRESEKRQRGRRRTDRVEREG